MSDDIQWFAGVDWASEIHQVVLVDAHSTVTGEHTFPHGGEGLGVMCDWLLTTTGAPAHRRRQSRWPSKCRMAQWSRR